MLSKRRNNYLFSFFIVIIIAFTPLFSGIENPVLDNQRSPAKSPSALATDLEIIDDDKGKKTRANGEEDPYYEEIETGLWEITWNFTNSSNYEINNVVLNNGTAELIKKNGTISFSQSDFQTGQFNNTVLDYNNRISLLMEKEYRFLIADSGNQRVLELDEGDRQIWQYGQNETAGNGTGLLRTPQSISIMNNSNILIADTLNHRVLEINKSNNDNIDWFFGDGTAGSGGNRLNVPSYAFELASKDILVTDTNNHKVVKINKKTGNKGWTYGTGVPGSGNNQLNFPSSAVELANGTILIADGSNHRVIIVDQSKKVLWQYGDGSQGFGTNQLNFPGFADQLNNGNILITDTFNQRVIEVNLTNDINWQYGTDGISGFGPNQLELPQRAYQLGDNKIAIADTGNNRVLLVSKSNQWLWQYGENGTEGVLEGYLNISMDLDTQEVEYSQTGDYISEVIDAGSPVFWKSFQSEFISSAETTIELFFRIGTTQVPDAGTWTTWSGPYGQSANFSFNSTGQQYVQFKINLNTTNLSLTPRFNSILFNYQKYNNTGEIILGGYEDDKILQFENFNISTNKKQIINCYFSIDGGNSWTEVPSNNSLKGIDTTPGKIRFKVEMITTDPIQTPILNWVKMRVSRFGSLTSIEVIPKTLNISAGKVFVFSVIGYDNVGNELAISPSWSTNVGVMDGNVFTAQEEVDTGYVNATVDEIIGTCIVNITPAELNKIVVYPFEVNLTAGDIQEFTAIGYDGFNNVKDFIPTWETTVPGGEMDGNLFKAPLEEGNGFVLARNGTVIGYSIVKVRFDVKHPPPKINGIIPNQVRDEDAPPWTLPLSTYEFDVDDSGPDLNWYIEGNDNELFYISGEYSEDDVITFIPRPHAFGSKKLKIYLEDSMGFIDTQEFWVNLTPKNDQPWIRKIPDLNLKKNVDFIFDFTPYIDDIDNPISELSIYTFSSSGQNYITMEGLQGTINYPGSFKKDQDIITITVSDGDKFSEDLFFINFSSNAPPAIKEGMTFPDRGSFYEDKSKVIVNNIYDYFEDPEGGTLTFSFYSKHINAEIVNNSLIISSKNRDWFGNDILIVKAYDGADGFIEKFITVIVIPVNDPPFISDIPEINVHFNVDTEFFLKPYIGDVDNATSDLTVKVNDDINIKKHLRDPHILILNYSHSLSGFEVSVNVTVSDGLNTASKTITIYVSDNFPPVLKKPLRPVQFYEDEKLNNHFDLDDYFYDPDGPSLIYNIINGSVHVETDNNNVVDFSAPKDWNGPEQITFIVKDRNNATIYAAMDVFVIPVNDKPTLSPIPTQTGEVGTLWVLDLSPYVNDPDNPIEELTFSFNEPKGYAILHGSSILFYYDDLLTEALSVEVKDDSEASSESFVVEFTHYDQNGITPGEEEAKDPLIMRALLIFLVAIAINVVIFSVYLFRKYRGKFKLEDLFLIHANGNLISHVGGNSRISTDNEILSGMLTAIQDFIKDGFSGGADTSGDEWSLDHLKFGDRNIFIERHEYMYIAAVFKGEAGWKLRNELKNVLKQIDAKHSKRLYTWSGALDGLEDINSILLKEFEIFSPKEKQKVFKREYEADEHIPMEETEAAPAASVAGKISAAPIAEPISAGPIKGEPVADAKHLAPMAKPVMNYIAYLIGKSPALPEPLSPLEKEKLPRTKPISDKYRDYERRLINV